MRDGLLAYVWDGLTAGRVRAELENRWRFLGRHRFVDRSKGHSRAVLLLAGHKPFLWPFTLPRIARHVPSDVDVCLVTPGVDHREMAEIAARYGWSYLSTRHGNISLAQNLAIRALPGASLIYKIDEDIFISERFFDALAEGYRRSQRESDVAVGFCAPLVNVNGFSYVDFVRARGVEEEYCQRFGELRRAAGGIPACDDGEAAVFLWERTLPVDVVASTFHEQPFAYSVVPHRYSIGAILFERVIWEEMGGHWRGFGSPALGVDELGIAMTCFRRSQVVAVVHNVFAGHFAFGLQERAMRAAYEAQLSRF